MCNTAAQLTDRVLPAVPLRQWVLSLPFELRRLAAFHAGVARALGRIFIESIALEQKRAAGIAGSRPAAINHIQRFGGSLNLNLHFHAIVADGVFAAGDAGEICFRALEPPSRDMLERVIRRVRNRSLRWLRLKGFLDKQGAEDRSNEPAERSAIDACADIALQGGGFAAFDHHAAASDDDGQARFEPKRRGPFTAVLDGFNVQAAVRIEAGDDEGRERLARYCARPCFAMGRLSLLRDGRVAYRVKYPGRGGTHRVMTPVELLARLAALVPPPRYPLVRYHGVLAPHSKWRSAVVPKAPPAAHAHSPVAQPQRKDKQIPATPAGTPPPANQSPARPLVVPCVTSHAPAPAQAPTSFPSAGASPQPYAKPPGGRAVPPPVPAAERRPGAPPVQRPETAAHGGVIITDFGISVRHFERLLGGLVLATSPRVDWAKLLRRTYAVDVLACTHCGSGLRLLSAITDKATAEKILQHLGLAADPPPVQARSRDPTEPYAELPPAPW